MKCCGMAGEGHLCIKLLNGEDISQFVVCRMCLRSATKFTSELSRTKKKKSSKYLIHTVSDASSI